MATIQSLKLNTKESLTFKESYEHLKAMCTVIATNITHDVELAEDIVQSAFVKIMEHKDKYFSLPNPKRDAYIVVMVKNKAIDTMRKKSNTEIPIECINESELKCIVLSDVEKAFEDKEGYEYLRKLIKELPPLYQIVFEMRYIEGFSTEEISQILDVKKSTVIKQLGRAKEKMKKKVSKKAIFIIVALLLTVSALMFNDDVRAAMWVRFVDWWQNRFAIYFHGSNNDANLSHYFWKPQYVPNNFYVIFSEHDYNYYTGAFSSISYTSNPTLYSDSFFIMFTAGWMYWHEDGIMGAGRIFPSEGVEHTIITNNRVEFHLLIAQTEEGLRSLGGLPVSILWEREGFEFHMLGNISHETLLEMAMSVVPLP